MQFLRDFALRVVAVSSPFVPAKAPSQQDGTRQIAAGD
jgi:hypothetical protein